MAINRPYDIAIIGWGTRGVRQLTLEHLEILKSGRDLVVSPGASEDLWEFFKKLKLKIHDVTPLYRQGEIPSQVYRRIAEVVLRLGKRYGRTVFVQFGHPLVYSKPSRIVLQESRRLGLRTYIYPGISSIDQILCLLEIDIAERDVQICHAGSLLRQKKVLNPRMDLILMQLGRLGEMRLCLDIEKRARNVKIELFRKLQRLLEKFYPRTNPMWVVCLNGSLDLSDQIVEATIGDLVKLAPAFHVGHTVYIKSLVGCG